MPLARQAYREPVIVHDLGRMDVTCPSCQALHWRDEQLSKSGPSSPVFGRCCNSGKITTLPRLPDPPPAFRELFSADSPIAKEFRSNIRQYNAAFAFVSLGVQVNESINHHRPGAPAPYVFQIHGELCHRLGSLLPASGQAPSYAQTFIYDPREALNARASRNTSLARSTLQLIQETLDACNPYIRIYKHAHEVLSHYPVNEDVSVRLIVDANQDRRRYNLPSADDVAILLPGEGTGDFRDIVLRCREGPLHRINECHPAYSPLHYTLLFPLGSAGWRSDLGVTQTCYYSYQLHSRADEFSTILRAGRLLQQYIVDMWAVSDQSRLLWFQRNQDTIRASLYSGLEDAVRGSQDVDLNELGTLTVLPSSYTGGPRYMQQLFQDGMAIARCHKSVDLFLTMTANPRWPEITRELFPGQEVSDRPDLVARVFQLKKKALLHEILKDGIFGQAVAHIYTIEFQKRGLPHMHLLIFLARPDKLLDPETVDSCIRAEWPDPATEPVLFEVVKTCMVHGPCGALNPSAPCMDNGCCTKNYPKDFHEATTLPREGYPLYRRRNDGCTYDIRGKMVDNRWIVPHNPYLLARYNCHINVECSASFATLKYINKYIHKGHDRGTLEFSCRDEIKRYIDAHYISAPEGIWRIFHFLLHEQEPNIVRLQVHLPGHHLVRFRPGDDPEALLAHAANEQTMLTAFFTMNAEPPGEPGGEQARKLTYQEMPRHFVWKKSPRTWSLRKQGAPGLGRMYFVAPSMGERFYLRLLLTIVKGPTSFEDLRTFNGALLPTFRAACLARGLLEDDAEWRQCLMEATMMQTGSCL